jgi:hypothetical protein
LVSAQLLAHLSSTEASMTNVITGPFGVVKPGVSWKSAQAVMISIGACLLLAVVSYIIIANLSLDSIEVAGETIWVHP